MKQVTPLNELVSIIIQEMKNSKFNSGTIHNYERIFLRLQKLADKRREVCYNPELGQAFTKDNHYENSGNYCHTRYCFHYRCIQFIESYIKNGSVDWSPQKRKPESALKSIEFSNAKIEFENLMTTNGLKTNTKDGYGRLLNYFLSYLENQGYHAFTEIQNGDIFTFIAMVCQEHYIPTSLGAHLPGLKLFLNMTDSTIKFVNELPERLPRKTDILDVYTEEEHAKIIHHLDNATISLRDKAICLIALEIGLRAVDICNLKLQDINWQHDFMQIIQKKTGRSLNIPLTASYGNAIAEYLLSERPASDSKFVFLQKAAPYASIKSHSACRYIIYKAVTNAGIEADGRPYGTRITRHSVASRMLRKGVPMSVISEALGHGNPNSVMVYLSTEGAKLAECTLPLPGKEIS
ncbi:MAG: tyrosine-type recombinase/integrase [Clostridiaceae bacterium]